MKWLATCIALCSALISFQSHSAAEEPYGVDLVEFDQQSEENAAQLLLDAETEDFRLYVRLDVPESGNRAAAIAAAAVGLRSAIGISGNPPKYEFYALEDEPVVYVKATTKRVMILMQTADVLYFRKELMFQEMLADTLNTINLNAATSAGFTGATKKIVVIDSGVSSAHPMLQGKIAQGVCKATRFPTRCLPALPNGDLALLESICGAASGPGAGEPCSLPNGYVGVANVGNCGHGTHVAAIAAATAPSAQFVSIQASTIHSRRFDVCSDSGTPQVDRDYIEADVYDALKWVDDHPDGIAAVNLSLAVPERPCNSVGTAWPEFGNLVNSLRDKGIATVIASGNGNNGGSGVPLDIMSPGCHATNAIKVGAALKNGQFALDYSAAGNVNKFILAPGGNSGSSMLSCQPSQQCLTNPTVAACNVCSANVALDFNICVTMPTTHPNWECACSPQAPPYCSRAGTSMAAPHVAGAFALLRGKYPDTQADSFVDAAFAVMAATGEQVNIDSYTKPRLNIGRAALNSANPATLVAESLACGSVKLTWTDSALGKPELYKLELSQSNQFTPGVQTTEVIIGNTINTHTAQVPAGLTYARLRGCLSSTVCPEVSQLNTIRNAQVSVAACPQPPVIHGLPPAQPMREDTVWGPFAFTVSDPDTPANQITVFGTSSNASIIRDTDVLIGGSGTNRTITLTPVADANGPVTIAVTARDPQLLSTTHNIAVTVAPVNDAPSFTFITDCKVNGGNWDADSTPPTFRIRNGVSAVQTCGEFTDPVFGPANESHQYFALPAAVLIEDVSNSSLFFEQPNFTSAINQLRFSTTGLAGSADITIRIRDDGGTANEGIDLSTPRTFRVIVAHRPVITGLPTTTQTFLEDAPVGPLHFTIADADSDVNQLTVEAYGSDGFLQAQDGIVISGTGANRSIQISPVADFNGSAVLTVVVTDSDGNSESAEVAFDVTPVNDAPSFEFTEHCGMNAVWEPDGFPPALTLAPSTERPYACPDFTVPNFGPGKELDQSFAAPSSQAVQIISISDDSIFTIPPHFSGATNELLFKPNGTIGYADVVIRIRDNGGTEHGGVDLSETKSFRIRVGEPIGAVVDFTEVPGIPCSPAAVAWNPAVGYPDAAYEIEETCPVFNAPSITQVHSSFATSVAPYISEECNTVGGPVATYRVRACSSPSVCGPWSGSLHAVRPDGCYD